MTVFKILQMGGKSTKIDPSHRHYLKQNCVADGSQEPGFSNPQAKCQIQIKKTLTSSQMIGISKYFNKLVQLSLVRGAQCSKGFRGYR